VSSYYYPYFILIGLRTYAAMGILKELSGILFGRPGGQVQLEQFDKYDKVISQVILEEQGLADLPVITHMDFGHTDPMFVLPCGIQAEINCDTQQFTILENPVGD
jgi:muramoyltetrapeptide carboxypeptidase LdcA involved in peptidoglycan recycling